MASCTVYHSPIFTVSTRQSRQSTLLRRRGGGRPSPASGLVAEALARGRRQWPPLAPGGEAFEAGDGPLQRRLGVHVQLEAELAPAEVLDQVLEQDPGPVVAQLLGCGDLCRSRARRQCGGRDALAPALHPDLADRFGPATPRVAATKASREIRPASKRAASRVCRRQPGRKVRASIADASTS